MNAECLGTRYISMIMRNRGLEFLGEMRLVVVNARIVCVEVVICVSLGMSEGRSLSGKDTPGRNYD